MSYKYIMWLNELGRESTEHLFLKLITFKFILTSYFMFSTSKFFSFPTNLVIGEEMSRFKVKPKIRVRYEGDPAGEDLTEEDLESIERGLMDVLEGRILSTEELIDELVKEGKLTEKEAEELKSWLKS